MKYHFLFTTLFLILSFFVRPVFSQENPTLEKEIALIQKFKRIQVSEDDNLRERINDSIILEIEALIKNPEIYNSGFDTLSMVGNIISSDEKIRVITWNLPYIDGTNAYFGFIQHKEKDDIRTIPLIFASNNIQVSEQQTILPSQWYGALYYQIVTTKHGGQRYYTLCGFIPDNIFTHKKVIDLLLIDEAGIPHFGAPIFQTQEGLKKRMIFEYSARLVMMMRYNRKMDMIVYDHLSPSSPNYKDRFQFYGPDLSYDGIKFEKGQWIEIQDINLEY